MQQPITPAHAGPPAFRVLGLRSIPMPPLVDDRRVRARYVVARSPFAVVPLHRTFRSGSSWPCECERGESCARYFACDSGPPTRMSAEIDAWDPDGYFGVNYVQRLIGAPREWAARYLLPYRVRGPVRRIVVPEPLAQLEVERLEMPVEFDPLGFTRALWREKFDLPARASDRWETWHIPPALCTWREGAWVVDFCGFCSCRHVHVPARGSERASVLGRQRAECRLGSITHYEMTAEDPYHVDQFRR